MLKFRFTNDLHEVVYADLLIIGGKTCLIMGSGKTTTGTGAMHGDDGLENILATDFVRLGVSNGTMTGMYDPGMFGEFAVTELPSNIHLAVFLGSQRQSEMGGPTTATRLTAGEFCDAAAWHVVNFQPRSGASAAFAALALGGSEPLPIDPELRMKTFRSVLSSAVGLPMYFIPYTVDQSDRITMLNAIIDQL